MRSYYRLIILNVAVMAPLIMPVVRRQPWMNPKIYLLACLALPFMNYMVTRNIARQRGTSTSSFELGLWASWVLGPSVTAVFVLDVGIHLVKRDFGRAHVALGNLWPSVAAWIMVQKAEREGWWGKIDPKGPKTLGEALRS